MQISFETSGLNRVVTLLGLLPERLRDNALRRFGDRAAAEVVKMVMETASTWEHKPSISKKVSVHSSGVTSTVSINDEVWVYVSMGTRAHQIEPRGNYPLVFQLGYVPKTSPGSLTSRSGGKFGPFTARYSVYHPGTEPREFHKLIIDKMRTKAAEMVLAEVSQTVSRLAGGFI